MNVLHSLGLFTLDDLVRIGFHNPLALVGFAPQDIPTAVRPLAFSPATGFTIA